MNLTLLSAWNPYYLILNGPSWSLSALACYYILFPSLAGRFFWMKSPKLGLLILGILFLLPGAIADLFNRTDLLTDGLLHHNPIIRLPLFLSGIVLCVLYSRHQAGESEPRYITASAGIILVTFFGAAYLVFNDFRPHVLQNGFYFPAALAAVWICAWAKPTVKTRMLSWGARLGAASLPMFLLHVPLFHLFTKLEKFFVGVATSPDANYTSVISTGHNIDQALVFYPLYIIPLIAFCVFTQERFVTPLREKLKSHFATHDNPSRRIRKVADKV